MNIGEPKMPTPDERAKRKAERASTDDDGNKKVGKDMEDLERENEELKEELRNLRERVEKINKTIDENFSRGKGTEQIDGKQEE